MQSCVAMFIRVFGLLGACALCAGIAPAQAQQSVVSPEVIHTGTGPTGYTVTFRYAGPDARKVQVRGEWFFARPGDLDPIAPTPDHPVVESQGILPADWQPGDFPLPRPNATGGNWPVMDLAQDADGIWSITLPLPSGTFSYSFVIDCDEQAGSRCARISDPANRPWNESGGKVAGSVVRSSQVFVPSDRTFNTVDYAWQGPPTVAGKLTHLSYPSPGHLAPKNENYLVVYTPPGYDSARSKPYPTFYLSHGGGGNEMDWSTQGVAANILDNLINTGEIQPIVVVMPNAGGYPESELFAAYDQDLVENMIPFVEAHYNVSKSARDRAFSGLSMGGMLTNTFIFKYPGEFQYFGMMSAGLPPEFSNPTPEQVAALKGKTVWVGGGWQDVIHAAGFKTTATSHTGPAREVSTFAAAGVPVATNFVNGGHQWYVWRILLKDFLTRAAFLPPPYAAW